MELHGLIDKLKLEHLGPQLDTLCEQAAKRELDYRSFLTESLHVEWRGRQSKGIEVRLKQARFPAYKTLEDFDFAFQKSIDKKVVTELAGLAFVERGHNAVLLGPPGVGKTTLARLIAASSEMRFTPFSAVMSVMVTTSDSGSSSCSITGTAWMSK
jgi:DNA replication protein DnaC